MLYEIVNICENWSILYIKLYWSHLQMKTMAASTSMLFLSLVVGLACLGLDGRLHAGLKPNANQMQTKRKPNTN